MEDEKLEDSIVAHSNLAKIANAVDLCSATWPGKPFAWVEAATGVAASQAIASYPDANGSPALRVAVASHYQDRRISPSNVTIASGATGALLISLAAVTKSGDEIVTIEPGYTLSRFTLDTMGLTPRPTPAWSPPVDGSGGWCLNIKRVAAAISPKTSAILVVDPGNPLGSVLSQADWQELIDAAWRAGCRVIADRVYEPYGLDASPVASGWLLDRGVIVLSSMTKSFHAPGLRVGWILAEPNLGAALAQAMSLLLGGVSEPAQAIAAAVLSNMPADHLALEVARARGMRRALASALAGAGFEAWPSGGGLFLTVPALALGTGNSVEAWRRLLKLGVGGVPSSAFRSSPEPDHDAFVRLTFARDFETIAAVRARFGGVPIAERKGYIDEARSA